MKTITITDKTVNLPVVEASNGIKIGTLTAPLFLKDTLHFTYENLFNFTYLLIDVHNDDNFKIPALVHRLNIVDWNDKNISVKSSGVDLIKNSSRFFPDAYVSLINLNVKSQDNELMGQICSAKLDYNTGEIISVKIKDADGNLIEIKPNEFVSIDDDNVIILQRNNKSENISDSKSIQENSIKDICDQIADGESNKEKPLKFEELKFKTDDEVLNNEKISDSLAISEHCKIKNIDNQKEKDILPLFQPMDKNKSKEKTQEDILPLIQPLDNSSVDVNKTNKNDPFNYISDKDFLKQDDALNLMSTVEKNDRDLVSNIVESNTGLDLEAPIKEQKNELNVDNNLTLSKFPLEHNDSEETVDINHFDIFGNASEKIETDLEANLENELSEQPVENSKKTKKERKSSHKKAKKQKEKKKEKVKKPKTKKDHTYLKNVVSQSLGMLLFMAMLLLLYYFQLL